MMNKLVLTGPLRINADYDGSAVVVDDMPLAVALREHLGLARGEAFEGADVRVVIAFEGANE